MKSSCVRSILVVLVGTCALGLKAHAVPLDEATCERASQEQAQLGDVPTILARGAEWAQSTRLPAVTLARIERWIALQEQLSFRCGKGLVTAEAQRAARAADAIENPPPPPQPKVVAPTLITQPTGDAVSTTASPVEPAPPIAALAVPVPADGEAKPVAKPAKAKTRPKPKPKPAAETAAPVEAPLEAEAKPVLKKKRTPKPQVTVTPEANAPPTAAQ